MANKKIVAILLSGSLFCAGAQASMRCGTSLVHLDDTSEQVEAKCGLADSQTSERPALRSDGVPQLGAVRVDRWVYGPRSGAYYHLRFLDKRLVEIRMEREQ